MRIFNVILVGVALGLIGPLAAAQASDIVKVKSSADVAATTDALEAAVTGAGATVFARVDHGAGAAKAGLELADAQLLIFGNPKLGTPAMNEDALAGLFLPLRVLVYEDGAGEVWLAYEDPSAMLGPLEGTSADAPYLTKMTGALKKLTAAASGAGG
ncbi:MAG: DUF302 domain-containing protein [Pseudomonadota bacterium]